MRRSARDSLAHLLFKGKASEFCPLGVAAWRAQNRVRFVTENFSLLFSLIWTNLNQFDTPDPTQDTAAIESQTTVIGNQLSLCRLHHSKLLRCVLLSCVYVSCSLTLAVSAFLPWLRFHYECIGYWYTNIDYFITLPSKKICGKAVVIQV